MYGFPFLVISYTAGKWTAERYEMGSSPIEPEPAPNRGSSSGCAFLTADKALKPTKLVTISEGSRKSTINKAKCVSLSISKNQNIQRWKNGEKKLAIPKQQTEMKSEQLGDGKRKSQQLINHILTI